jgi:thiamine phosphate synthase YjbQ (UPF0047 family)
VAREPWVRWSETASVLMSLSAPVEIRLSLAPTRRFEVIDVVRRVLEEQGDVLRQHRKALYCSMHSTAGYLNESLAARMLHCRDRYSHFFKAFHSLFPSNGPYRHDRIEERTELSEEQRRTEPRNADSHLTFIGAGMRNCVTYRNNPAVPVWFIELDGTNGELRRRRETAVVAYDEERIVERASLSVPLSRHPMDSLNLADPRFGLVDLVNDILARRSLVKARVDIALDARERCAGLAVNEYETLLMRHDLVEVLRDPLRFAVQKGRRVLDDPLAAASKTLSYARYDAVQFLNSLIDALGVEQSVIERLVAKVIALPARHLLRSRRVSFLASDHGNEGGARLVRGSYQSPILIQWQAAQSQTRRLHVRVVALQ